ncbi:MAG: C40 family peptidase [Armatimonadetes bacterium]|nr:C40 family peptidase [Armatimonadota bacterium]
MNVIAQKPVVTLFAEPDERADIVSQLLLGAPARVREERDGWIYIQGSDAYCGWAMKGDLLPMTDRFPDEGEQVRIALLYANLRHRPCKRSAPLLCVPGGVTLPVAGREPGWVGMRLPDGRVGWLEEKRTEPVLPLPAEADALLTTARRYLSVPYLWGGVSGFGIDCSGLVQAVFGRHGIALPRDAHQQAELGSPVSRDAVRAGDLLYFAPQADAPRRRITHVGIAVDSGTMVHALGSESVVETPIESVSEFWGALRILADR